MYYYCVSFICRALIFFLMELLCCIIKESTSMQSECLIFTAFIKEYAIMNIPINCELNIVCRSELENNLSWMKLEG
jgi:hypothetical protein